MTQHLRATPKGLLALVAAVSCWSCGGVPEPRWIDATVASGLDFVHDNGMDGSFTIGEVMGSGGALFDFDRDGDLDLFLVQGGSLKQPAERPGDRLYRNEGTVDGVPQFRDVTAASALVEQDYGMAVAVADYDNDGWLDLYVTNDGPNRLWRNRGDGTFEDVTARAGVEEERWSVPTLFFDYDGDGWSDLYVGNYLEHDPATAPRCTTTAGRRDYCGALNFPPVEDRLWRNRGDGTFEDVTAEVGLARGTTAPGAALGALAADFDGDGRLDLYVANDATSNHLWLNRGDGRFEESALTAGLAVNGSGKAEASMGIAADDFDADGDLDLLLTHLVVETNTLYRNLGGGRFRDDTAVVGLGGPSVVNTGFGAVWLDDDRDGALDLLVVNGAVQTREELVQAGEAYPLHEENQLFRARDGRFTADSPPGGGRSEVSRGLLTGDVDNDGDLDVLVTNNHGPVRLYLRAGVPVGSWSGVVLETAAGGPATGAVAVDGAGRHRWQLAGGSYASVSDWRWQLTGAAATAATLEVRWPDGTVEAWRDLPRGRYSTLRQGAGDSLGVER
ncbi:MAG: CRTAC1 family protein [Acidobacteriota bacterium]